MILTIAVVGSVIIAILARPSWILPFAWVIVMCYPQNLLYNKLPLNAGIDDLFLILASLVTFVRLFRHNSLRQSRNVLLIVFGLSLMQILSEIAGMMQYPSLAQSTLKSSLKSLVVLLFIAALAMDIRREKDVRRHAFWLTAAITSAFGIVIICSYIPVAAGLWEVRGADTLNNLTVATNRAFGPFNGPAEVGGVACLCLPLIIGILVYCWHDIRIRAMMLISMLIILDGAIIISRNRTAVLGLGFMLTLALILSRRRWYIIGLGLVALLALVYVLYTNILLLAPVSDRFASGTIQEDFSTRLDIWNTVIKNPPRNILVGGGSEALMENMGITPHNGYLDMFYCWGLFGISMFSCLIYYSMKCSRWVIKHDTFPLGRGIGWGLLWSLVAVAFASITTDPWYMILFRLLLFGMLIMVNSRYQLTRAGTGRETLRKRKYLR